MKKISDSESSMKKEGNGTEGYNIRWEIHEPSSGRSHLSWNLNDNESATWISDGFGNLIAIMHGFSFVLLIDF